jgi:hypothetical protein
VPLRGTRCPCRGPVALMNRHATTNSTQSHVATSRSESRNLGTCSQVFPSSSRWKRSRICKCLISREL